MKTFNNLALSRRSIRKYTNEKIDNECIKKIISVALVAPTSKNSRPWYFVIVDDAVTIERLSQCKKNGALALGTCSHAIVVMADPFKSEAWIEDTSIAASYIQLAAEDLGLGSCWIQIRERMYDENTTAAEHVRDILSIPENIEIECIITLGHKNEERKAYDPKKTMWNRVSFNTWNIEE